MNLRWEAGLLPAVVQDADSGVVLMVGFMNPEALEATERSGKVTFFSRSRQRLWQKGGTSGHSLDVVDVHPDCDGDTLLVRARPRGPVCHRETPTCFDAPGPPHAFLATLEATIAQRLASAETTSSYVARLAAGGLDRVAQKVGEEAIETILASKNSDVEAFEGEAADLLFHLLVLLQTRGSSLRRVVSVLEERH